MSIIKKARIPKESWVAIVLLWLMYMLNANGREILNRLSPYICDNYNLSASSFSIITVVASIGVAIASCFVPAWADSKGKGWKRKYTLIAFSVGYMLFTALCGFKIITGLFAVFVILQFFRGFFAGCGDASEVGNVTEWFPREKSGIALGIQHSSYPWGSFLGGLMITATLLIVGDDHWRVCWFIFPAIGIIIWIFLAKIWNPKTYKRFEEATEEAGWTPPLKGADQEAKQVGSMKDCAKNPHCWVAFFAFLFVMLSYYGYALWMPLYLAYIADYDYAIAASLSVIFTITAGLGQIVWGVLSDKFGAKRCTVICALWYAAGLASMPLISHGMFFLIACQLFMGCASNGIFIIIYDLLAKSVPAGTTITSFGFANIGMYIGAAAGSAIGGLLIDLGGGLESTSGYMVAIYVFAAMAVACSVTTMIFARETNGKRLGRSWSLIPENKYYLIMKEMKQEENNESRE